MYFSIQVLVIFLINLSSLSGELSFVHLIKKPIEQNIRFRMFYFNHPLMKYIYKKRDAFKKEKIR